MKIHEDVEFVGTSSVPTYLDAIQKVISDETKAIQMYDDLLGLSDLPASSREVINEIREDEKDHLVVLTSLLGDELEEVMPDSGDALTIEDEDNMQYEPVVDGGLFIVDESQD